MKRLKHIISILDTYQGIVLIAINVTLLIAGLFYSVILGNTLRYPDEKEYYAIANNLVTRGIYSIDGLHPTAYRPPGYPLLLSVLMFLGSNVVALRFFNFVLFAGTLFFLHKLTKNSFNRAAAALSIFILLLYPVLFYTAGTLYPQTFGSFLFLIFLYLIFQSERYSTKRALLAGLVVGYLILTISTFVFVFAVTLLYLILRRRPFKEVAIIFLTASLVIAPWIMRNYITFDAFIPFATNSGINLLLGNSPNTTANAGVNVDLSAYTAHAKTLSEIERDAYYRSMALHFIIENPSRAFILYLQKLLNHFNFRNELATKSEASIFKDTIMFLSFYPLLLIAVARFLLFKKYPLSQIEKYFAVIYVLNAFFQAIFFTRIRFRLSFDLLLISIAASFISNILHQSQLEGKQVRSDYFDADR